MVTLLFLTPSLITVIYELNVCAAPSQNSYVEALTPNIAVFGVLSAKSLQLCLTP